MKKDKIRIQSYVQRDKEVKIMKHLLSDIEEEEKATERHQFLSSSENNDQYNSN